MLVVLKFEKITSLMSSVQFAFGHPGAPGIGVTGPPVSTLKPTLPFLISDPGIAWSPPRVTTAGFCPGAWCWPPFVQVATGCPCAVNWMTRSPFPSPVSAPVAFRVSPPSVNVNGGLFLKWTFAATAADTPRTSAAITIKTTLLRRIALSPSLSSGTITPASRKPVVRSPLSINLIRPQSSPSANSDFTGAK